MARAARREAAGAGNTLGASNIKWFEWLPQNFVFHEAHVEAVERGVHLITIANQPGCEVHEVYLDGDLLPETGLQTVAVRIRNTKKETTVFIDVDSIRGLAIPQ